MNDFFKRTSSSALVMVGTPVQIKAELSIWMQQYGRDMPLAYVLSLHKNKKPSPKITTLEDSSSVSSL